MSPVFDKNTIVAPLARSFGVPVASNFLEAREGDPCGIIGDDREVCPGTLGYAPVENCNCHVSPPCGACVANPLRCGTCFETMERDG